MKILNKNKRVLSALFLSGWVLAPNLLAQEAENPSAEKKQEPQTQTSKPSNTKQSNSKPSEQVFKPSEEISEDSPVPFPVDI